jgi:hypothetical protein
VADQPCPRPPPGQVVRCSQPLQFIQAFVAQALNVSEEDQEVNPGAQVGHAQVGPDTLLAPAVPEQRHRQDRRDPLADYVLPDALGGRSGNARP